MNIFSKQYFLTIISGIVFFLATHAQTNVSGGIFVNTTWTTANSPYIVTTTVVVFPGVVLTIQPGVTVKFADGQQLEIRQGQLISTGTIVAPIIFTSNSGSPTSGIYSGIYLNLVTAAHSFDYCSFLYADFGIRTNSSSALTVTNSNFISNNTGVFSGAYVTISNSLFRFNSADGIRDAGGNISNSRIVQNGTGVDGNGGPSSSMTNCVVDSNSTGVSNASGTFLYCTFNYNLTGIDQNGGMTVDSCVVNGNQHGIVNLIGGTIKNSVIDSNSVVGVNAVWSGAFIYNCEIKNNAIGIDDYRLGNFSYPHNSITKNTIESNGIGIILELPGENIYCNRICNNTTYGLKYLAAQNTSVANNFWCTNDSASTEVVVYDAHDNVASGILTIMPLDTVQCYLVNPVVTGISNIQSPNFTFNIFPNPATTTLTLTLPKTFSTSEIKIFNVLGELEYAAFTSTNEIEISVSNLDKGMHIIQITNGSSIGREKFVKE